MTRVEQPAADGSGREEIDLGRRLRALRRRHGLSQRELARRAGITHGSISLIEQNRVSPSVASLRKVLAGFPMSLSEFFALDDDAPPRIFFSADEFTQAVRGPITRWQLGTDLRARRLQLLIERYEPGADTGRPLLRHAGEEAGVVLSGQVEVTVGGEARVLGPGDGFYFDSRLPHRFRTVGDEECELISVCTPPLF